MLRVTGPGDQQHVGMARRGGEPDAEALDVVDRVVERVDLQLAAVARAGIDLADGDRAPEQFPRTRLERAPELGERRIGHRRRADRHRPGEKRSEAAACAWLQVVPRIRAVERFVAEREVGDDVAFDRGFEQRPLEPRRVAGVAARDPSARARRSHTNRSPRNASTIATPSRGSAMIGTGTRSGPAGKAASQRPDQHGMLASTSRMRTHTRASTSPAVSTGTSNGTPS